MTKSKKKQSLPEMRLDAQIRDSEEVRPWNAPLWNALGQVVSFLPTFRNTREGRSTRKQIRAILLVIGIGMMAFGGQAESAPALWILLGVAIASSVFVIPVEDLKKRGWRSTIKKKQKPQSRPRWRPGAVVVREGRLELELGDRREKKIGVDRQKHDLVTRRCGDLTCLGVLPPGAKKDANIWVCTDGAPGAVDVDERIAEEQMELPAKVSTTDWERLWDALEQSE